MEQLVLFLMTGRHAHVGWPPLVVDWLALKRDSNHHDWSPTQHDSSRRSDDPNGFYWQNKRPDRFFEEHTHGNGAFDLVQ